jgi:predicted ATP-grasp superfamily ATP-dependent carboligase
VLCESIPPLPDLVEPADRLVRAAGLDGVSMVEFRRDRSGQPVLMEINARLPGSVALAIAAGVDFPQLIYSWAVGRPLQKIGQYRVGCRQRWLSSDIWYLKDVFQGPGRPDMPSRGRAVATFLWDFVSHPSTLDGFDPSDPIPALFELQHGVVGPIFRRAIQSASGFRRRLKRTHGSK